MKDRFRDMAGGRTFGVKKTPGDLSEDPLWLQGFVATALLVSIGGFAAPSTVNSAAILSTLPYFAILAVASIGQHLVIQQRGLDLSVAGIMSVTAVIVSALPSSEAGVPQTLGFVVLALAMGLGVRAVNRVLVALPRV